jgi:hypothetical protein
METSYFLVSYCSVGEYLPGLTPAGSSSVWSMGCSDSSALSFPFTDGAAPDGLRDDQPSQAGEQLRCLVRDFACFTTAPPSLAQSRVFVLGLVHFRPSQVWMHLANPLSLMWFFRFFGGVSTSISSSGWRRLCLLQELSDAKKRMYESCTYEVEASMAYVVAESSWENSRENFNA